MRDLDHLFANNRVWAETLRAKSPELFERTARQQRPPYLWIGCSDSRVPASQIVGLAPGELFVHRNIANVVAQTDLSCLSVLQYAVDVLEIRHVVVCGHYGCGGVRAALEEARPGLIDSWAHNVRQVAQQHRATLDQMDDPADRWDRLCELNVIEQVRNVARTAIVQEAWAREQPLSIHGWIYGLQDGLLRDLQMDVTGPETLVRSYEKAMAVRPTP